MSTFQYQQQVEPLVPLSGSAVPSVDGWQPQATPTSRPARSVLAQLLVAPPVVTPTLDGWQPITNRLLPARLSVARAPVTVAPFVVTTAPVPPLDGWAPQLFVPRATRPSPIAGQSVVNPSSVTLPADLFEAIVVACNTDATLASLFGRQGWLWITEAPDGEPMPYAVLSQPASELSFSTFTDDGSEPTVESATYQVSIFSTSRALNQSIGDQVNASLSPADLRHADGYLMALRVTSAADMLDPDRGPGGVDVWQRVLLLDVLEGHNQTVVTTTYSPAQQPADLTAAMVGLLGTDATLGGPGYFNRSDWLWIGEAPVGQTLPYAVLVQTRSVRGIETTSNDASRPAIEHSSYECHVFASSRSACRMLGERISGLVDGAALTFGNGYLMYLRRQFDTDTLDDDRSRLGQDVWHRAITIAAISGHSET